MKCPRFRSGRCRGRRPSQNRQAGIDRITAEHDYKVNRLALAYLAAWHHDTHGADCRCVQESALDLTLESLTDPSGTPSSTPSGSQGSTPGSIPGSTQGDAATGAQFGAPAGVPGPGPGR